GGMTITPDYDSLIAKLVVWAPTRDQARARLRRALDEFAVQGVATTIPLLRALVDEPSVCAATYGTATLEPFAAAAKLRPTPTANADEPDASSDCTVRVEVNGKLFRVRMLDQTAAGAPTQGRRPPPKLQSRSGKATKNDNAVTAPMHGVVVEVKVKPNDAIESGALVAVIEAMKMMNEIRSPRAGTVAEVKVAAGQTVETGAVLVTFN
ncbi:MAG: biotin/lipoyl-containing protein, partial [Vulcanimicrobiaceae bacterium]